MSIVEISSPDRGVVVRRHPEAFCSNFPSRVSVGGGHTNVISAAIKEGLALTELHMSKTRGDPGQGRIQSIVTAAPLSPTAQKEGRERYAGRKKKKKKEAEERYAAFRAQNP